MSKSKKWFDENVVENKKELLEIGELANKMLHEKISLGLADPRTTIAIYAMIFETFCNEIAGKQKKWDEFSLNIADRLRIGYTTTSDENDEKTGNFMVFIQHIENTQGDDTIDDDDELDTIVLCTQWNAANMNTQSDMVGSIAAVAKTNLKSLINIKMESHEFIVPMFCIIHAQIINYIRLKRVEEQKTSYELDVAGLYTVGIEETDDAEEHIYFEPSISLKLLFKNDAGSTGKNE